MNAWDKQYPITDKECSRANIIAKIQGNTNPVAESRCD